MISRLLGVSLLMVCMAWAGHVRAGESLTGDYIPGLDDVPLAPGLVAEAEPAIQFDKPEGRLVETSATGRQSVAGINDFYTNTLPQMGWHQDKNHPGRYVRDREMLDVAAIARRDGQSVVTFRLAPK